MNAETSVKKIDRPAWHLSYAAALVFLFAVVGAAGLLLRPRGYALPVIVYWIEVGMAFVLVCLMAYAMLRKRATFSWWETMLWLMSMVGIWVLALSALPPWAAVLLAAAVTLGSYFWPLTVWHNAGLLIGSAGIGLLVALKFPFMVMLISALGATLYEALRPRDTGLATMFSEADRAGVVPGLLLPAGAGGWFKSVFKVWRPGEGQIIGVLPAMVMAAMAFQIAGKSAIFLVAYAVCVTMAGAVWGLDERHALRAWVYPAAAAAVYAVYGLAKVFIL